MQESDIHQFPQITIQVLLLLIQCAQIKINKQYNQAYLVFALPLSGKTTITHHLAGNQLIIKEINGRSTFQVKNDSVVGDAKIGNNNDQQTYIPNIFQTNTHTLIDYPIFKQSIGCFLPLWEIYLKEKVFSSFQKMQYIVILRYKSIVDRNPHEVIDTFTEFFKLIPEIEKEEEVERIKKHFYIIINEVPSKYKCEENLIKHLQRIKFKNHAKENIFSKIKQQVIRSSRVFLFYQASSDAQLTLNLQNINWGSAKVCSPQRNLKFYIEGENEEQFKTGYASMINFYKESVHQSFINIRHFFEIFVDLPQVKEFANLIIYSKKNSQRQQEFGIKNKLYLLYMNQYKERRAQYGREIFKQFDNCFIIKLKNNVEPILQDQISVQLQIISGYLKLLDIFSRAKNLLDQTTQKKDTDFCFQICELLKEAFGVTINLMKLVKKEIEIEEYFTGIVLRVISCSRIYKIFLRHLTLLPSSDAQKLTSFPSHLLKMILVDNSKMYKNLINFCQRLDLSTNYKKKAIYLYIIDIFIKIQGQIKKVPQNRYAFYKMSKETYVFWQYYLNYSIQIIQFKIALFQLQVENNYAQACKSLLKLQAKNIQYFEKLSAQKRFTTDNQILQKQYLRRSQGATFQILQYLSLGLKNLNLEQIAVKLYEILYDAYEVQIYYEKKEKEILDKTDEYNEKQRCQLFNFYQTYIRVLSKFSKTSQAVTKAKRAYHIAQISGETEKMIKFGELIKNLLSPKRNELIHSQNQYQEAITRASISILKLNSQLERQIIQKIN